jgi:hypothetical protein
MNNGRPLRIKSYLSSLPVRINGEEKINALTYFAEGVAHCGDHAEITRSQTYEDCDVGAIIGNAFNANPGKVNCLTTRFAKWSWTHNENSIVIGSA